MTHTQCFAPRKRGSDAKAQGSAVGTGPSGACKQQPRGIDTGLSRLQASAPFLPTCPAADCCLSRVRP